MQPRKSAGLAEVQVGVRAPSACYLHPLPRPCPSSGARAGSVLTEAVLGADVGVSAFHGVTVAVGAGLDAGGAGGEVPGDPYGTQQAVTTTREHPSWSDCQSREGRTPGPPRPSLHRPPQGEANRGLSREKPHVEPIPGESLGVRGVQGSPGSEGWAVPGLCPGSHQGGQKRPDKLGPSQGGTMSGTLTPVGEAWSQQWAKPKDVQAPSA